MAFQYYEWKNGKKAEKKDLQEWSEITEDQYLKICKSNKELELDKRRYFEKIPGIEEGDVTYYFECDLEAYRKYRREKEKEAYKKKEEMKDAELFGEITVLSFDAPYEDANGDVYTLHDLVADENSLFEDKSIQSVDLCNALVGLTDEERQIIDALFLSDKPSTVREYAERQDIPFTTVQSKKKKILWKLKKSFVQNGFFSAN